MLKIKVTKKWTKKEQTKARLLSASYDEFKYNWNRSKDYLLLEPQELSLKIFEDLFRSMNPVLRNNVPGFAETDTLEQRLSSHMSASAIRNMDFVIRELDNISKFRDNVFADELDEAYRKEIKSNARELRNKLRLLRKNMA